MKLSNYIRKHPVQYIADLRACRVRELEEKRINKEMAHIRQKFKGRSLLKHIILGRDSLLKQTATWMAIKSVNSM